MMAVYTIALSIFMAAMGYSATANAQSCNACNCHFNNIQLLEGLITAQVNQALANKSCDSQAEELVAAHVNRALANKTLCDEKVLEDLVTTKVNRTLAKEPLLRLLSIWMDTDRNLKLFATNHTTFEDNDATELASVSLNDPSQAVTSSNNLFGYRPRFSDHHNSGLAGVFINLEGVFPCLQSVSSYHPICQIFSDEEDGFRSGKALIGAGDRGNNFEIFTPTSSRFVTYGIAIQDCSEFDNTCFPTSVSFNIACYLPRAVCS